MGAKRSSLALFLGARDTLREMLGDFDPRASIWSVGVAHAHVGQLSGSSTLIHDRQWELDYV